MTKYQDLSAKLIDKVPELRVPYQGELRWWKGELPGPHIVFGDILVPFLIKLLRGGGSSEALDRAFAFLEVMATDSDPDVQGVVALSVLPGLGDDKRLLQLAREHMGPTTLAMSQDLDVSHGRPS